MMLSDAAKAGTAIFVGSVQFGIAMILAEVYYPNYNVSLNFISDLGAYCRDGSCTVYQPSATIFNTSIVIFGVLVLLTSYYLHRAFRSKVISVIVVIAGMGLVGVGADETGCEIRRGDVDRRSTASNQKGKLWVAAGSSIFTGDRVFERNLRVKERNRVRFKRL